MQPDAAWLDAVAGTFAVTDTESADNAPHGEAPAKAAPIPRPRKPARKADRTGRSAFAGDVCDAHGPGADGVPCAKFGHLPGKGKGIKQPSVLYVIWDIIRSIIPLLMVVGLLYGGVYVLNSFVLNGNFLRSGSDISESACYLPDGSVNEANRGLSCRLPDGNRGIGGVTPSVRPTEEVAPS